MALLVRVYEREDEPVLDFLAAAPGQVPMAETRAGLE